MCPFVLALKIDNMLYLVDGLARIVCTINLEEI